MAKTPGLSSIAHKMLYELKRRFAFVCDPQAMDFDSLYVASTLLNPPYRKLLNDFKQQKTKKFIIHLMKKRTMSGHFSKWR